MKRFVMTREDNVFYAKRNLVDSIYKEARLEGIGVTFPETKEIFEGRTVSGLSVDQTVAINNLKHAWAFVLDNLDAPVDLAFVRQVHHLVGSALVSQPGQLRNFDVSIGGTTWKPDMPDLDAAKALVAGCVAQPTGTQRALNLFAALCRAQLFSDGNKRTAQLVANKLLISDGCGILAVPVELKAEFEARLIEYYETADAAPLTEWVGEYCLDGYNS